MNQFVIRCSIAVRSSENYKVKLDGKRVRDEKHGNVEKNDQERRKQS